jgi:hypothetical protein
MIAGRPTRRWLLWGQERTQLLPVLICQSRNCQQWQGNWQGLRDGGSLSSAAEPMEALSLPLVQASKARPVQALGLLLLRLAQRL